ncbi:MAG: pyridoxal phosphate-dependent aminotransferase [Cypionkella sp.]
MRLAKLIAQVPASPIGQMFNRATALRAEGRDLIDFSLGEPDFDTPEHIRAAGIAAIRAKQTRYTASDGTAELKDAVRRKFLRDNSLTFARSEVVIASGAKPLIASAMQVLLDPDDEVILFTPVWTSHVGMVQACGAKPVLVPVADGSAIDVEACETAISPKTRLLLICSPSNPSGAVASRKELSALAKMLRRHPDIAVISDDLYEHIVFAPAQFCTLAEVAPDLADRILTVNGLSKAYAMTGWRIGYAGGPDWWVNGLRVLFSQTNGGPCSISQIAGIAALDGPQDLLAERRQVYERRRDLALQEIGRIDLLRASKPDGAFFIFVQCGSCIGLTMPGGGKILTSGDLADYFLQAGVVTVPGAAFYADPFVRISIATSDANIIEGMRRIRAACADIRKEGA